jgi:ADP-heptose:LPS heptosyltransferase
MMSDVFLDLGSLGRILVVKLSSMGDILHATPAIRALREACPAAHISFVVESRFAALVRGNGHIDHLIEVGSRPRRRFRRRLQVWRQLRAEVSRGIDLALDLQGTDRSAAWIEASRASFKAGLVVPDEAGRWQGRSDWQHVRARELEHHAIEECAGLVDALGATCRDLSPELRLDPRDEERTAAFLARCSLPADGFAIVNPFSIWPSKQWPSRRYAEMIRRLAPEFDVPLLLTGGSAEVDRARELLMQLDGQPVFSCVGRLPLGESLCLYRRAALMVTGDSGPMHAAAALGTPVVALFGPTWPGRTGPWGDGHEIVQTLSPPQHTAYRNDPGCRYIRAIEVDAVVEAVRRVRSGCQRA